MGGGGLGRGGGESCRRLRHSPDRAHAYGYLWLYFVFAANAILVVVSRVLDAVCHPDGTCAFLTKTRYLQILICVEVVIALSLLIVYFGQCHVK